MNKLKPCPFCGAKAALVKNYLGQYSVRCLNDRCVAVVWGDEKAPDQKNAAVDAWNRRATS